MIKFSRRDWLRSTGMLGTSALLTGFSIDNYPASLSSNKRKKIIRLSSNENPYGPSESVRRAMIADFDEGCRYPWGAALNELMDMLAEKEGVSRDHLVITGGSTEGLKIAGSYYGMNGGEIIAPQPTFLAMLNHAVHFGSTTDWVGVNSDMTLDLEKIRAQIDPKTKLIFLCNPNNPTSTIVGRKELRKFVEEVSEDVVVFSDEAYYDYIEEENYPSMVEYVKQGKDVIVSRTFSKVYGLAGLRIGYLIAKPAIAGELRKRLVAFTNVLALRAAVEALKDEEFYDFSLKVNRDNKEKIYSTLKELNLEYVPSHTNFVFFKSGIDIRKLNEEFRDRGIMIGRPFPPFMDWCRISTGKTGEVDAFCEVLKEIYG